MLSTSLNISLPRFFVAALLMFCVIPSALALQPKLAFSDLISGPDVGLGDPRGSGVVVTVWGQNLGSTQDESKIEFCDSTSVCRKGFVFYWKNADGNLPSGPSDLFKSHRMQEIAFSIPKSAPGAGEIKVTVNNQTSQLPFTVRSGNIYHVMKSGNDEAGDGSFSSPWATVAKADGIATAGDTIYIHDVDTYGDNQTGRVFYNNRGFKANTKNQFVYASYPGTRARLYGKIGVHMYLTTGIVSSKLSVFTSNCPDETLDGCVERGTVGITPSDWGRVIGNELTDRPGMCSSGQAGAISGGIDHVEGAKVFGNYIHDYGCPRTGKLHHTTYFTIRDNQNDKTIASWELGWNFLINNHAKNGLHFYDENVGSGTECGDLSTNMRIHDNVIQNQGGAGIQVESACGWTQNTYIENNILINVGLPIDTDCSFNCGNVSSAIVVGDQTDHGLLGNVYISNNTVYGWDSKKQTDTLAACIVLRGSGDSAKVFFNDNICTNFHDSEFVKTHSFSPSVDHSDNISGSNNIFYIANSSLNNSGSVPSSFDRSIFSDPLISLYNSLISIEEASPALGKSGSSLSFDIYGTKRPSSGSALGAVEYKSLSTPFSA
ncbi:hypothetical protein ACFQGA_10875 [Marinobacter koreensis]|uniref:hypothetical protein n=1 Tax=Marinobacter koreensis TaxID=335974 RepID=UPI00361B4A42